MTNAEGMSKVELTKRCLSLRSFGSEPRTYRRLTFQSSTSVVGISFRKREGR